MTPDAIKRAATPRFITTLERLGESARAFRALGVPDADAARMARDIMAATPEGRSALRQLTTIDGLLRDTPLAKRWATVREQAGSGVSRA